MLLLHVVVVVVVVVGFSYPLVRCRCMVTQIVLMSVAQVKSVTKVLGDRQARSVTKASGVTKVLF